MGRSGRFGCVNYGEPLGGSECVLKRRTRLTRPNRLPHDVISRNSLVRPAGERRYSIQQHRYSPGTGLSQGDKGCKPECPRSFCCWDRQRERDNWHLHQHASGKRRFQRSPAGNLWGRPARRAFLVARPAFRFRFSGVCTPTVPMSVSSTETTSSGTGAIFGCATSTGGMTLARAGFDSLAEAAALRLLRLSSIALRRAALSAASCLIRCSTGSILMERRSGRTRRGGCWGGPVRVLSSPCLGSV